MATHTIFLPVKSYGERSLAGYSPWGPKVGHDLATKTKPTEMLFHGSEKAYFISLFYVLQSPAVSICYPIL